MIAGRGRERTLSRMRARSATLKRRTKESPLRWMRWMRPQVAWLRLNSRIKLLRAGNQAIGKTTAGLAEVVWRARGHHPYHLVPAAPQQIIICCTTNRQSLAIQRKLWALLDRRELAPETNFSKKNGFGVNVPMVVFANGSTILFATDEAGPSSVQGNTVNYIHIDELCSLEMFRELERRISTTGGKIGMTLTPVNRPAAWLRELVEDGIVTEIHAKLSLQNLQYFDGGGQRKLEDGTICDQRWIDEQWRIVPDLYAGVVLDGDWETRPEGQFFKAFNPKQHVTKQLQFPAGPPVYWHLGIDYAAADRDFGQVAVLLKVQHHQPPDGKPYDLVQVVDEVVMNGVASSSQFAEAVIAMLARTGISWRHLKTIYGDNPVQSRWVEKSNTNTMKALARELSLSYNALQPRILGAKEGTQSAGSRDAGCRWIYEGLARKFFVVHPRCTAVIQALETWDYSRDHKFCDVVDALRYALKPYIFPRVRGGASTLVFG